VTRSPIRSLRKIAFGIIHNSSIILNGVEWDVTFSISSDLYRWHGKFGIVNNEDFTIDEFREKRYSRIDHDDPEVEIEELYLNNELVVCRNNGSINFQGTPITLKLSPSESLIKILRSEDKIVPIVHGLLSIVDSKVQNPGRWTGSSGPDRTDGLSLVEIGKINSTLVDLLGLIWINHSEIFARIKSNLIEIFPQVEDLRVLKTLTSLQWSETPATIFSLELKEIGVARWITQSNISTGMLKTLAHIVEIYLLAEGSILLIDEFENSLGVNCIDVITELLNDRKDIQFIITSHHPYIINKIPMQYWKIVTRKGSVVTATKATDYEELSGSRHQVFTQLINLPEYTEGIQAA
jgi:hypothetical protein